MQGSILSRRQLLGVLAGLFGCFSWARSPARAHQLLANGVRELLPLPPPDRFVSVRVYSYDAAGRLVSTQDQPRLMMSVPPCTKDTAAGTTCFTYG